MSGTWTSNHWFFAPPAGPNYDSNYKTGLDQVDARLSRIIYAGDPNYATIAAGIATLNSAGTACTFVVPPGFAETISADLTVNSNILFKAEKGCTITIATGKTLTVNGPFQVGLYQVFSCVGTGKVVFGSGAVDVAYPEWWGVTGTADNVAVNAALTSTKHVKLTKSIYTTAATININSYNILEGNSRDGTTQIQPNAETFAAITVKGAVYSWEIRHLSINYGIATSNTAASNSAAKGISIINDVSDYPYFFNIHDVNIYYPYNGVYEQDLSFMGTFTNVYVSVCGHYGFYFPLSTGTTTLTFTNCYVNGGVGGFYMENIDQLEMIACASDNISKGSNCNYFQSCIGNILGFQVESNTIGDNKSIILIAGGQLHISGYKGVNNVYDEAGGTESYGIRAGSSASVWLFAPKNVNETHSGAGTCYAAVGASDNTQFLVIANSLAAPTGGSTNGVYTANGKIGLWNGIYPPGEYLTWTPSLGGTTTYTTRIGYYFRTGNQVTVVGMITVNALGTGSATVVSGLPYTTADLGMAQSGTVSYFVGINTTVTFLGIYAENNATTMKFTDTQAVATATINNGTSVFKDGATVAFTVTYLCQ